MLWQPLLLGYEDGGEASLWDAHFGAEPAADHAANSRAGADTSLGLPEWTPIVIYTRVRVHGKCMMMRLQIGQHGRCRCTAWAARVDPHRQAA